MEPMHIIDKLALIYIKDRKLLGTRSKGKDAYYLPGGKREQGEEDHQALIREIKEELAIDLKPETIRHFGTFQAQAHGEPEGFFVRMTCFEADYQGTPTPSMEIEELDWLVHADRFTDRTGPGMKVVLDYLKEKNLVD